MIKKSFLGAAFGGGGARGAAHIGVLQEMTLAGIGIDMVAGVSAGSVIAAMYAFSKDPFWIESRFRKLWSNDSYRKPYKVFFTDKNPKSFIDSMRKLFVDHSLAVLTQIAWLIYFFVVASQYCCADAIGAVHFSPLTLTYTDL